MIDELKMRLECAAAHLAELGWTEELADKDQLVRRANFEIAKALKVKDTDSEVMAAAEAWFDAYLPFFALHYNAPIDIIETVSDAYGVATQALLDAVAERRRADGLGE